MDPKRIAFIVGLAIVIITHLSMLLGVPIPEILKAYHAQVNLLAAILIFYGRCRCLNK
jgi:putative Mn2+ efflux pump MntP